MSTAATQGQTPLLWFGDHLVRIHIDGPTSGAMLALLEERGRDGDMPPLHVHRLDHESFYVLDGEVRLFFADEDRLLRPGQAALAPRQVPHTYRVESPEARWLVITTPAGFDGFVLAVSEAAPVEDLPPRGRELDLGALAPAALEAGIEILGPPGALPC